MVYYISKASVNLFLYCSSIADPICSWHCLHRPLACPWNTLLPYPSAYLPCGYQIWADFWLHFCLPSVSNLSASCWPGLSNPALDLLPAPDPAVAVLVISSCSSACATSQLPLHIQMHISALKQVFSAFPPRARAVREAFRQVCYNSEEKNTCGFSQSFFCLIILLGPLSLFFISESLEVWIAMMWETKKTIPFNVGA